MAPKTIETHLQALPEPYRSQALRNLDSEKRKDQAATLRSALTMAFLWFRSPEKYAYWRKVYETLPLEYPELIKLPK